MDITKVSQTGYRIRTPEGCATVAEANGELQVEWLWINPDQRRTGAAESLLAAVKQHFNLPLRPTCVLETALGFWQRMTQKGIALEPDYVY